VLAFTIAAFAYSSDVRSRRLRQARLVFGEFESIDPFAAGEKTLFLTEGSSGAGGDAICMPIQGTDDKRIFENSIRYVVCVHNDSDEIIDMVFATLVKSPPKIAAPLDGVVGVVHPHSVGRIEMWRQNPAHPSLVLSDLEITFRDSSGRRWRRRETQRVRRARMLSVRQFARRNKNRLKAWLHATNKPSAPRA